MRPQDTNLNLLIGTLWDIRELCEKSKTNFNAHEDLAFYVQDQIDICCRVLTPPVDLDTWDNDYLVTGHCPTCAQLSPINDP